MRIKRLVLTSYKSVKRRETLLTDEKITILIGANDHGKSNLLAAIRCLNDDSPIDSEDKNWDAAAEEIVKIQWHFSASEEVNQKLNELRAQDPTPEGAEAEQCFPVNEVGEIVFCRDITTNAVKVESLPINIPISKESVILQLRPRVELFQSPTSNLIDQVNLQQLSTPEFEFMQGIFRLAGIWDVRNDIFDQNDKTSRIINEASSRLTEVLNDKWNQGKDLKWKFEHAGTNGDHIVIKIEDPAIQGRYTRPSLRSSGFKTYFLLSMITLARTQNKPSNSYVYLFDEPGTYLHPHAQLDLQRSFESIAERTQIIYTTHSLFLVSKNHPERNRVISKTKQGTKIDQKPFIKNWKSVRDSLGILLSNNFLIADKTLLVEGPSDVIYLLDAIKKLKNLGRIDVDLNDFSVVDAGSSENYVAMAKLMLSEGRDIVALIDGNGGGRNIESQLKKTCENELSSKKLKIHKLPENNSAEDVFADIDALRVAIKTVYGSLVSNHGRQIRSGLNVTTELEGIRPDATRTLGQIISQETSAWFEPEEKISKLSIALEYENVRQDGSGGVPDRAFAEVEKIRKLLILRGEKSAESGVFEETE